jgi:diguanylate cyclase (GGDEF)-like protein
MSFEDDVTGLYNRRFLLMRLEEEIRLSRPLTLVLFEFAGLGVVADTAGYATYDDTLAALARILKLSERSKGSVIARYDGSRFAALLVDTPRDAVLRFVQMVRDTVASRYPNGQEVAIKVGIASPPDDGGGAFELMSAADAALRRSLLRH